MYAAQRRTHYSPRFEKLRELLEHDEILQARLRSRDDSEASSCNESAQPVTGESLRPVEGIAPVPSVNSLLQLRSKHHPTPSVFLWSNLRHWRLPRPQPRLSAARCKRLSRQVEELENSPELSNQKVQVILKAVEGTASHPEGGELALSQPPRKEVRGLPHDLAAGLREGAPGSHATSSRTST